MNASLVNHHFILQIFSFTIDVFIPHRISPDWPFKTNQRQVKILILSLQCAVSSNVYDAHRRDWPHAVMHTLEIDLAVWLTSRRNRKRIWKYGSLFVRGPDGFKSWKNWGKKSCDPLSLRVFIIYLFYLIAPETWLKIRYNRAYFESFKFFQWHITSNHTKSKHENNSKGNIEVLLLNQNY